MTAEGHKVASLHGAKDGSERDKIIDSFREGSLDHYEHHCAWYRYPSSTCGRGLSLRLADYVLPQVFFTFEGA